MAASTPTVVQHLRRMLLPRDGAGRSDSQLLDAYVRQRDEVALAALVHRHGPMVWGVCRRVLRSQHDAEDAFQATFLVFVRKAASIATRDLLANWLYGVAHRAALKARSQVSRRQQREKQVMTMPEPAATETCLDGELTFVLDQELYRLPAKYRTAIVLCDLEGRTRKEAADQLGLPEGTVASRLARARGLLAGRLKRLGLGVAAGAVNEALAQGAFASTVPPYVLTTTVQALTAPAGSGVSAKAVLIADAVVRGLLVRRLVGPVLVLVGLMLLGGIGGMMHAAPVKRERAVAAAATDDQPGSATAATQDRDSNPLDHLHEHLLALIKFHLVQLHNLLHPPAPESPHQPAPDTKPGV